jgi:hypothetical protein
MKCNNRLLLPLSLCLLGLGLSLACNYPVTLNPFLNVSGESSQHTLVAQYDATIVSAEGEILDLGFIRGMEWVCEDVKGELFALSVGEIPTMKYKKAEVQWEIAYNESDEWFGVRYSKDIDRDYAVLAADGSISSWENDRWSGHSFLNGVRIKKNGGFKGKLIVPITSEDSFPEHTVWNKEEPHNFFGLFTVSDHSLAYLCDQGPNPIPNDITILTPENFKNYCSNYYYECPINR